MRQRAQVQEVLLWNVKAVYEIDCNQSVRGAGRKSRGPGRRTHRMASLRSACRRGATRSGLGSSGFELRYRLSVIKHGLLTLYKVACQFEFTSLRQAVFHFRHSLER
jgi:hypothetical protein